MANQVALTAGVYLGPLDASANTSKVTFGPMVADVVEFPNFGAGGTMTRRPGLISAEVDIELWQDYAASGLDQTIGLTQFLTRPQYPMSFVPGIGTTAIAAGDRAYLTRGFLSQLDQPFEIGAAAATTLGVRADTAFVRGYVGAPRAARSSTLTGTAVAQAGPSATGFLYAALHVFATTGSPTLDVTIQSDDNGGFASPATRITFTQATSAGGAPWFQWGTPVGNFATETHLRVSGVYGGSGTIDYAVTFGVI